MARRFALLFIGVALIFLVLQNRTSAQSVYNLQADLYSLRQQVSQLRAQVNQLSRQNYPSSPPPSAVPRNQPRYSEDLSDRQMLDRLAVLAIEAKDRLKSLEQRVSRLEKSVK